MIALISYKGLNNEPANAENFEVVEVTMEDGQEYYFTKGEWEQIRKELMPYGPNGPRTPE